MQCRNAYPAVVAILLIVNVRKNGVREDLLLRQQIDHHAELRVSVRELAPEVLVCLARRHWPSLIVTTTRPVTVPSM